MKLEQFKNEMMSLHDTYKTGFFHMNRTPENASGEVILASLYRNIGYKIGEGEVNKANKVFLSRLAKGQQFDPSWQTGIDVEKWQQGILGRILASPKQPGQPKRKLIQLTPLVPDATLYSSAARFTGNPWNPGPLTASIIGYGCNTTSDMHNTWMELFNALSVDDSDDIWARFLSQEFSTWREPVYKWEMNKIEEECRLEKNDRMKYNIPAKRFVKDLRSIIGLKLALTRRQWISLVESIVRIGTASHVLWLCNVNKGVWSFFKKCLLGTSPPFLQELGEVVMSAPEGFWRYGESALPILREKARDYITARVGINYVLFLIDELVQSGKLEPVKPAPAELKFQKVEDVQLVCSYLFENRDMLMRNDILNETAKLLERDPRLLAGSTSIPKGLTEFLRYSLGQRRTVNKEDINYDQGYWLNKKWNNNNAPWVIAAGPISLIAMAYCCANESSAPRTIDDFCRHVGQYGISMKPKELSSNGLSRSLRNLGIVVDSPDAEGGIVVLNPFKNLVNNS